MIIYCRTLQEEIEKIKPIDLVVGICAKDVETTIVHTMNVVGMGLQPCNSRCLTPRFSLCR